MPQISGTEPEAAHTKAAREVWQGSLWMGASTTLLLLVLLFLGIFDGVELKSLDARFYWRGARPAQPDIVLVGIDDVSFGVINKQWPWPRSVHARLVDALHAAGAKVIGFDILFSEPSANPSDDQALAQAMAKAGNVVLVNQVSEAAGGAHFGVQVTHPMEVLAKAAAQIGFANTPFDQDGFVRRAYIAEEYNGELRTAFPLALAAQATGKSPRQAAELAAAGKPWIPYNGQRLSLRPDGTYQVNFAGPPRTFPTFSYYQILEGAIPKEWLQDKIVLVGAVDETLHDTFHTPYFTNDPTPGVEVHANALATLLSGNAIQVPPWWGPYALLLVTAGLTSVSLGLFGPWRGLAVAIAEVVILAATAMGLFNYNIWVPLVPPVFAILSCYATITGYRFVREERERRRIRSLFGRYVSDDVVKEIVDKSEDIVLGGKRQPVTILFSDIRGFTTLSEHMPPENVVSLLNEYFDRMTEVIFASGGTIDKFVGDCIMALWGAPIPSEGDAGRAVRAAVLMRQALANLQEQWRQEGKQPFETGIGINSADVVVGNIGSHKRLDYTVIGDGVNLASRLESSTKELGAALVISETTYKLVESQVIARKLNPIMVKGKEQPVTTYEVLGWREPDGTVLDAPGWKSNANPAAM